jgi:hypothetical protein
VNAEILGDLAESVLSCPQKGGVIDKNRSDPVCGGQMQHCFWKKQPETEAELERAIAVLETQEPGRHRYAGTDPAILDRILSACCDSPVQPPSALHDESTTDSVAPLFALLDDHLGGDRQIVES